MIPTNREKHDVVIIKNNVPCGEAHLTTVECKNINNNSKKRLLRNEKIVLQGNLLTASFLSGACAGAFAKTVIAPLDRTKIIFQVSQTQFSYRKFKEIIIRGYQKHGILHLWRGNSASMVRIAPYAAIQFTAHEQLKIFLANKNQDSYPNLKRFFAGSLAGGIASFLTYPLDMIRARMAVVGKKKYKTLRHAIMSVYKQEGIRTFYNGFIPTIIGIVPYAGTSFYVNGTLKKEYFKIYPGEPLTTPYQLLFGGIAGACGQSLSYPLDIIRRRQQTDGLDGKGYRYRSMIWTIKYILHTEGLIKGLYKGLSINFLKGPIAVGISFTTYDKCIHFLSLYMDFSLTDL